MAKVDTIYFIHHSHTDIGYTHDQPIVWDLHERFIDQAIECADRYADREGDHAFRWTVESTAVLWRWLQHASSKQVDRFLELERAGRIEVTAMLANITPLFDIDQLIESVQLITRLRENYGMTIRHAMNCDVNGQNWPLVDVLLDMGIDGFSMAVNPHYGASPFKRPNGFHWEGPSGRKLLTWNGWLYITGTRFGMGEDTIDQFKTVWWPRVSQYLDQIAYPHAKLLIQSAHPFGDNGSAFGGFSRFIARWNAVGKLPRIVFATPSMWWQAIEPDTHSWPAFRGDWTDYWNFGCISSAREQGINRASRVRLRTADALAAGLLGGSPSVEGDQLARVYGRYRDEAWHHLHFWDEHTWGADQAIHQPYLEDVAAQWHHKAHSAYQARSLSLMLQRDGLAALAHRVPADQPGSFLLFNPLPWPRVIAGDVPPGILSIRNLAWDDTASRHFQDRMIDMDSLTLLSAQQEEHLNINARLRDVLVLKPVEVPGFGYRVVSQNDFASVAETISAGETAVIENHRHKLVFDPQKGGVHSWFDRKLDVEWVDRDDGRPLHQFVYETVADKDHAHPRTLHYEEMWDAEGVDYPDGWKPDWRADRQSAAAVLSHKVFRTALGQFVIQELSAPGCESSLRQTVFLPDFADYVECTSSWRMGLASDPESTYLLFPFHLPHAVARVDLGGQAIIVGEDQLPGVCRDYFTTQGWVDFNNGQRGMTIATPENPLIQLGDFHFGHRQREFSLERALLLGWVTSNYWGTNFRAHQPGEVRARYRLYPYEGDFDEGQAHRLGLEAAHKRPLLQQFGEPQPAEPDRPAVGSLLQLPEALDPDSSIVTLHLLPSGPGEGLFVRLLNAGDEPQLAVIGSGVLGIQSARRCSLSQVPLEEIAVEDGTVSCWLGPREIGVVWLLISQARQHPIVKGLEAKSRQPRRVLR